VPDARSRSDGRRSSKHGGPDSRRRDAPTEFDAVVVVRSVAQTGGIGLVDGELAGVGVDRENARTLATAAVGDEQRRPNSLSRFDVVLEGVGARTRRRP